MSCSASKVKYFMRGEGGGRVSHGESSQNALVKKKGKSHMYLSIGHPKGENNRRNRCNQQFAIIESYHLRKEAGLAKK